MTEATSPVRVSILMDNTAGKGLSCEWGFAAAVEAKDELWLWDTGATAKFLANAALMGIDPQQAAGLALSHGHLDHTGGLPALREAGFQGPVLAHPGCVKPRYQIPGSSTKSIGITAPLEEFTPVNETHRLNGAITMITGIPRHPGNYEAIKGFSFSPKELVPDPVADDAFLLLKTPRGWVALLGCCHSGLMNSLLSLRERMGIDTVHAVIGGLHLHDAPHKAVEESAEACRMFGVHKLAAGHCTGAQSAKELAAMLDCEFVNLHSGLHLDF